uniref:Centrosomal protein 135 n=1 Tax=Petromyzon marinus TaxID=7757 RepID=S4RJ48_PETMA
MGSAAERKFVSLRKRLDQLGYRQPLGVETLPLVEKIFGDLVHTTESLRNAQLAAGKTEKEARNVDTLVEPYRGENARLVRDNNALHMELIRAREECERIGKDLKGTIRRLEHENADLKFLNNQYVHKVRSLEKEGRAKSDRIATLQEKNMQAVVQTLGGKQRSIPFHRQRMQIDEMVPPSVLSAPPVAQPHDPYVVDIVQLTSTRLEEQEREVQRLKDELERSELGLKTLRKQRSLQQSENKLRLCVGVQHGLVMCKWVANRSNKIMHSHTFISTSLFTGFNRSLHYYALIYTERQISSIIYFQPQWSTPLCFPMGLGEQLSRMCSRLMACAVSICDEWFQKMTKEKIRKLQKKQSTTLTQTKIYVKSMLNIKLPTAQVGLRAYNTDAHAYIQVVHRSARRRSNGIQVFGEFTVTEREPYLYLSRCGRLARATRQQGHIPWHVTPLVFPGHDLPSVLNRPPPISRRLPPVGVRVLRESERRRAVLPRQGGTYESRLVQVTRERDELQGMLDKFERHIAEIQGNVKVLTAERDKTNSLYQQSQEELARLRREAVRSPKSARAGLGAQAVLRRVERERDDAIADLRRMTTERDSLRQRLQIAQETAISERARLEQRLEDVEANALTLEGERSDLRARSAALKDSVAGLEEEVKGQARRLAEREDELARHKSELGSLRLLNEQAEEAVSEVQRRLVAKSAELQSTQDRGARLDDKIGTEEIRCYGRQEEVASLRAAVSDLDREKDGLQEAVDDKTEAIVVLEERLAQKDKSIGDLRVTASELESTLEKGRNTLLKR